jgi:hypothetical protein
MDRYFAGRDCPKCGGHWVTTRFNRADACGRAVEHLIRHCSNCGYEWAEAPLDAERARS